MIARFVFIMSILIPAAADAQSMAGRPKVIDGDTLEIGGRIIHLFGIDAPESEQTCSIGSQAWRCGEEATFALTFEATIHWVVCNERGLDAEGLSTAVCTAGPHDLSERMVRQGWALVDRRQTNAYLSAEEEARTAKAGVWKGSFTPPWDWRRQRQAPPPASTR